jgi:hypothetical protein
MAPGAPGADASPRQGGRPATRTLWTLFLAHRWRILVTYALFNAENLLWLVQPLALGLAITDLGRGSGRGLAWLGAVHLAYLLVGSARQAYGTRTYTRITSDLACRLVVAQRGGGVEVARVAARSSMSRELVNFFERDLAVLVAAGYSVAGALVMLGLYDRALVPLCLALALPTSLLGSACGRRASALNGRLNDELEREVEIIQGSRPREVRDHYDRVARWRVGLSDWQAVHFGLTQFGILALLVAVLARFCSQGGDAGRILAASRYVLMFAMGLNSLPMLVQQFARLGDIGRRLRDSGESRESGAPAVEVIGAGEIPRGLRVSPARQAMSTRPSRARGQDQDGPAPPY